MAKTRSPVEPPRPPDGSDRPADRSADRPADRPDRSNGKKNGSGKGKAAASAPAGKGSVERFYAQLDKCWELMEAGDLEAAKESALKLLRADGDSPELYVLLGGIAVAEGDVDTAISHYKRASEIDDGYVEPLLCAAELYLWDFEDFEQAVELCKRALDVAEEEEEYVEALLLKAEGEALLEKDDAAYASLSELPDVVLSDHSYHLRAGRLLLDLGHVDDAEAHFQKALTVEPSDPDSLHGLGLCAEARGDRKSMIRHFQKVRAADLKLPTPPWSMSKEEFSQAVAASMEKLPEPVKKLLGNVPVVAADYPSAELVADGIDPRLLGLFTGVPHGDKPTVGGVPHLDTILLFQRNLERVAMSREELESEIEVTVAHEAGHFFGLSDTQLEEMGYG